MNAKSLGGTAMTLTSVSTIGAAASLSASSVMAQSAGRIRRRVGVVPIDYEETQTKNIIDPPLLEPISHEMVVIRYWPENLRIVQLFASAEPIHPIEPAAISPQPREICQPSLSISEDL